MEPIFEAVLKGEKEVATHPVGTTLRRPEPYGATVLYLQQSGAFKRLPDDATVLPDRAVELYPAGPDGKETRYWVEHADGARSGGSGIQW